MSALYLRRFAFYGSTIFRRCGWQPVSRREIPYSRYERHCFVLSLSFPSLLRDVNWRPTSTKCHKSRDFYWHTLGKLRKVDLSTFGSMHFYA